jgi:NADPH-dependent curcumin reductase CurA
VGLLRLSDFHLAYSSLPSPGPREVLVRVQYLALDPHMRPRMSAASAGGRPLALGAVIAGAVVGRVVRSEDSGLRVGDTVEGMLGWQEYAVAGGRELRKVVSGPLPLSTALGVLGLPGLTAYFGLLDVGKPQPGETVVVSGATGAIGMVAGQIARLVPCRVVGLAAGRGDASWLRDELGFDAAVTDGDLDGKLAELCPDGVDVYFDTVGGATTEAVLRRINPGARICTCGQSSQDDPDQPEPGPRWLDRLSAQQASVQGFLVSACAERFPAALERLGRWLAQGELGYREDIAQGIEAAPRAFIRMLRGESQGHQLVEMWAA